ncbi:MAG: ABC transporter ATP-binding protein [Armatimonadetes bacterium]|nr:ABC transporter ATP-binding protein [Armatimonadota bacterium]
MLRVEEVSKSFDGFRAVHQAHLSVEAGAIVAVIGPNGAGKTTLFNLITGVLTPDRGRVLFEGVEISRQPPYEICRRGIARTFQIANIFPRLTVFANVQVAVLAHERQSLNLIRPARTLAVRETTSILEGTGLQHKARRLAGALSHGDQRILEIAIALGSQPRLLVLDEPTAGMSPEETAATMALIRRLARERGLTILFCEHDMEVVFSVAESIMVMRQGRTIVQGPPDAVRQNREVQEAYLGTSHA